MAAWCVGHLTSPNQANIGGLRTAFAPRRPSGPLIILAATSAYTSEASGQRSFPDRGHDHLTGGGGRGVVAPLSVPILLDPRIAGCLLLLYAQPVSRIVQLTIDDVTAGDSGVALRLGQPPSPVPTPLHGLLLQHLSNLQAAPSSGQWLFPGRRAAQPLNPTTLRDLLRGAGIPPEAGRTGTLRQLVLQTPPPVAAEALGYHHISTTRVAAQAGSPWSQYAPGDHTE